MGLVDLFVKLLETKERNRQLILREYVVPLKQQMDGLHVEYLENFHQYRSELMSGGVTSSLRSRIELDINKIIGHRADVALLLSHLPKATKKRTDGHQKEVAALAHSVAQYLDPSRDVQSLMMRGSLSSPNPAYQSLRLVLPGDSKSVDATVAAIDLLDFLIKSLASRYLAFLETYSTLRESLLR